MAARVSSLNSAVSVGIGNRGMACLLVVAVVLDVKLPASALPGSAATCLHMSARSGQLQDSSIGRGEAIGRGSIEPVG